MLIKVPEICCSAGDELFPQGLGLAVSADLGANSIVAPP